MSKLAQEQYHYLLTGSTWPRCWLGRKTPTQTNSLTGDILHNNSSDSFQFCRACLSRRDKGIKRSARSSQSTCLLAFTLAFESIISHEWVASRQNHQNGMFAQRRLRSAWASAQSALSLRCPHEESLGPELPTERTAKTDQTGWMPRLIWVFAGRTFIFVRFVMRRLKCNVHVLVYMKYLFSRPDDHIYDLDLCHNRATSTSAELPWRCIMNLY